MSEEFGGGQVRRGRKILTVVVVLIAAVAVAGYFYADKVRLSLAKGDEKAKVQQEITKKDNASLLAKVGRLIVLPTGEEPQIGTVGDPSIGTAESLAKLQTFYTGVVNGDKIIVYMNARKAIIYSPTKNKLINVGPVYFQNDGAGATQ